MKNKEKIQILENRLNIQSNLLDKIITKLELDNEQEGLKQLDQSAFDHPYVDDRFKYVALNADSQAVFFESKPVISNCLDIWVVHTGSVMPMLKGYDTTNWQNSLIERESKPQLKQLDQSVFDGLDEKWRFAAVDSDGSRAVFTSDHITQTYGKHYVHALSGEVKQVLGRVDASNWQNSLIERDTAKELTGNELCKAMLARGDKYVMCFVSDESEESARHKDRVICSHGVDYFDDTTFDMWYFVVPINSQGEPLTSSDVGL